MTMRDLACSILGLCVLAATLAVEAAQRREIDWSNYDCSTRKSDNARRLCEERKAAELKCRDVPGEQRSKCASAAIQEIRRTAPSPLPDCSIKIPEARAFCEQDAQAIAYCNQQPVDLRKDCLVARRPNWRKEPRDCRLDSEPVFCRARNAAIAACQHLDGPSFDACIAQETPPSSLLLRDCTRWRERQDCEIQNKARAACAAKGLRSSDAADKCVEDNLPAEYKVRRVQEFWNKLFEGGLGPVK